MGTDPAGYSILSEPSAHTIVAGDFEAVFLPHHGMLGASFRYRGLELLRRVENLDSAAARGSTAGIPLLYPWANRLESLRYNAGGQEVQLATTSPLLHFDEHRLPMHGVPWSQLKWDVIEARKELLVGRLVWNRVDPLAIFPFPHQVEMTAMIRPDALTIETRLTSSVGPAPVSFGFHPYFGIPGLRRAQWHLKLPPMRTLVLDPNGIPTGEGAAFAGFDAELGESNFDDGFAVIEKRPIFSLLGAGLRITLEFLEGYRYAQIFAPKNKDYVAIEPMTAPTNALTRGCGLSFVGPGSEFRAAFRIGVEATP
jgi:galactose mutarotase-like enzyme